MVPAGPSVITPATDQLLLTDDGNCPQCPGCPGSYQGNEGPACKPANYADILIPDPSTAMITGGSRYPGGWIIWQTTEHCLDDSAHSQLEFMILIDF